MLIFKIEKVQKFGKFLELPLDINQFWRFKFWLFFTILITRKFGCSTFERSLIFKLETSDTLLFEILTLIHKIVLNIVKKIFFIVPDANKNVKELKLLYYILWEKNLEISFQNFQSFSCLFSGTFFLGKKK